MTHTQVDNATKADIQSHEGVVAVGEGERDGYPALIVSVTPESGLGPADFDENVQGLPVYVEEQEEIRELASNREILDPIRGGHAITNATESGRGTSGFIMTDGDTAYASSNYHVLTPNGGADVGDRVGHVALNSGGGIIDNQLIGRVDGYIPRSGQSVADFAWVELDSGIDSTNRVAGVGLVTDTGHVDVGDSVTKAGSTTGVTHGTVDQVGATIGVSGSGGVTMNDQIIATEMSSPGDSGSPVMKQNTTTAVGVLWGGSDGITAFTPLSNIENNCPLTVATSDVDEPESDPNQSPNANFQNVNKQPLWVELESTSTDPDGQVISHKWDWDDGTTSMGQVASHSYSSPGTYAVELMATDNNAATDTYTRDVVIHAPDDEPDDPDGGNGDGGNGGDGGTNQSGMGMIIALGLAGAYLRSRQG